MCSHKNYENGNSRKSFHRHAQTLKKILMFFLKHISIVLSSPDCQPFGSTLPWNLEPITPSVKHRHQSGPRLDTFPGGAEQWSEGR